MTLPTEGQKRDAIEHAQRLADGILDQTPNAATALLVAVRIVFAVERQMGVEETQKVLAEALAIVRSDGQPS